MLLIGLAVASASSQTAEFRFNGEPVAEGATVTIAATKNPLTKRVVCETGAILSLYNLSAQRQSGTVQLSQYDNTLGTTGGKICMGETCSSFSGSTFTKSFSVAANTAAATQYDVTPAQEGAMLTRMVATIGGETHTVIVRFTYGDVETSVRAAAAAATTLDVYTLSGRLLRRGASSVQGLARGVYIVKNQQGEARKLVVK